MTIQDQLDDLATRITALESHKEACDEQFGSDDTEVEYSMSYDLAVALNEARNTIARLEEVVADQDEQIDDLLKQLKMCAVSRNYGTWSL